MSSPCDLPRMQLDVLSILAERERSGASVVRELESQYDDPPHRSTVYHHLDALIESELVERNPRSSNDRAKQYSITPSGESTIREYATALAVRVQSGELHRR